MTVVIRIDDIGRNSDANKLSRWLDICKESGAISSIAVIPNYLDQNEDVIKLLKKAIIYGHGISLHGDTHKCSLVKEHKIMSDIFHEFVCYDYGPISKDYQTTLIRNGKEKLESLFDIELSSFVPPQHDYDEVTLNALVENGFSRISIENRHVMPYKKGGLLFVPVSNPDLAGFIYDEASSNKILELIIKKYRHKNEIYRGSTDYSKVDYLGLMLHLWSLDELQFGFWSKLLKTLSGYKTIDSIIAS